MKNSDFIEKRAKIMLARKSFWGYCMAIAPDFCDKDYLKQICNAIQEFIFDENELLIINAPPRHGKTRTMTLATEWLLGHNPKYKIMTCSYNEDLSLTFSKSVRNAIIGAEKFDKSKITFMDIFPKVNIKRGSSAAHKWALNNSEEDNYIATSPNGTATGIGANFIIIDDLIKNAEEAYNANVLEKHWKWFTDTILSRGEGNKSKIIVIMTRWSTKDLAGRLIQTFSENNIKFKHICLKACNNGKMLNNEVLNFEKYQMKLKLTSEAIVRANYDQEPIDEKGKLYEHLITYDKPPEFKRVLAYCDTADEGSDYLCSIVYGHGIDDLFYILDVIYTKESMEITEQKVAKQYLDYNVSIANIESNNGGKGFARAVDKIGREELNNRITIIKWFSQTHNKQARILSNATAVEKNIRFPVDWKQKWTEFYKSVTEYQKEGKNIHDDAEDVLTGIIEKSLIKNKLRFE